MAAVRYIGLHNHTLASDGFFAPLDIVAQAVALGYEKLMITDHNTIHGWLGLDLPHNVGGGIEMSGICPHTATEVHFLGYDLQLTQELLDYSQQYYDFYCLGWQTALVNFGAETIPETPAQFAQLRDELQAKGIPPQSLLAEWLKVLSFYRLRGKAPKYLSCQDAVDFLHRCGATVAIAHPQRYPFAMRDDLIAQVEALEVYHPTHSLPITNYWRSVALRLGKQVTGGHDFHGWQAPHWLPTPLPVTDDLLFVP